jgi:hypothetical protein
VNSQVQTIFPMGEDRINSLASQWMIRAVASEESFQSLMYAQLTWEEGWSKSPRVWHLANEWYMMSVNTINENMKNPAKALSESNIGAVWVLSIHRLEKPEDEVKRGILRPTQGPLNSLHMVDVYGGPIRPSKTHRVGFLKMLELRGGVRALGWGNTAYMISL